MSEAEQSRNGMESERSRNVMEPERSGAGMNGAGAEPE
jgi:hypothetical protein